MPLSDIDNNLKFSKGDHVIIKIDDEDPKKYAGIIVRHESENIYIVKLVNGSLLMKDVDLRFPESYLKHFNFNDERDWKIKQLLK